MYTPKRGDAVIYIERGREYNALVLAAHSLNDSHLGEDGQPQLHLAVLFDEPLDTNTKKPKATPIGYIPQTTTVHDVVHESHAFSDEYMKSHFLREVKEGDPHFVSAKAEILSRRGAGEWREVSELNSEMSATEIEQDRLIAWKQVHAERERADLAESVSESLRKEIAELPKITQLPKPIRDEDNSGNQ